MLLCFVVEAGKLYEVIITKLNVRQHKHREKPLTSVPTMDISFIQRLSFSIFLARCLCLSFNRLHVWERLILKINTSFSANGNWMLCTDERTSFALTFKVLSLISWSVFRHAVSIRCSNWNFLYHWTNNCFEFYKKKTYNSHVRVSGVYMYELYRGCYFFVIVADFYHFIVYIDFLYVCLLSHAVTYFILIDTVGLHKLRGFHGGAYLHKIIQVDWNVNVRQSLTWHELIDPLHMFDFLLP